MNRVRLNRNGEKAKEGLAELLSLVVEAGKPTSPDSIAIRNMYVYEIAKVIALLVDRNTLPEGAHIGKAANSAIFEICRQQDSSVDAFLIAIGQSASGQLGPLEAYSFLVRTTVWPDTTKEFDFPALDLHAELSATAPMDPRTIKSDGFDVDLLKRELALAWLSGTVRARSADAAATRAVHSCETLLGAMNFARNFGTLSIYRTLPSAPDNRVALSSDLLLFPLGESQVLKVCVSPDLRLPATQPLDERIEKESRWLLAQMGRHKSAVKLGRLMRLYHGAFVVEDMTTALIKAWRLCEAACGTSEDSQTARRLSLPVSDWAIHQALVLAAATARNVIVHEDDDYALAHECSQVLRSAFERYFQFCLRYPDHSLEDLHLLTDLRASDSDLDKQIWARNELKRLRQCLPPSDS